MRKTLMRYFQIVLALLAMITVSTNLRGQHPDFSKVQIKTTKISDNFYTLEGQGGTVGVLVGPDGVFMVDCQFAPLSDKLAAAIQQISDRPIRFLVNTHVHGDHTGGNENFRQDGRHDHRARTTAPAANASEPGR